MITPSTLASDHPIEASLPSAMPRAPRPFYWSVRCELWQNIWVVLTPFAAVLMLVAGYFNTLARPSRFAALFDLDAVSRHNAIGHPYAFSLSMVPVGAFFVGMVYSLFALSGERRDRSILFWKSLPVSDATIVLSKAAMVFVVLPLVVFVVTMLVHAAFLVIGGAALIATGRNPVALWQEMAPIDRLPVVFYGIGTLFLQHAPLYAWLLMVSAWAPRLAVLWAILPPYGIVAAERLVSGHSRLQEWLRDRMMGSFTRSFGIDPDRDSVRVIDRIAQLDPAALFGRPDFWIGLALATTFLWLAIRARRDREPI